MAEFIQTWIDHVNHRDDLIPTWRERKLHVVFQTNNHLFSLQIDPSGIRLEDSHEGEKHVLIRSSPTIMEELLLGEKKLTSLPPSTIDVKGTYRNILYLESLMLLSK